MGPFLSHVFLVLFIGDTHGKFLHGFKPFELLWFISNFNQLTRLSCATYRRYCRKRLSGFLQLRSCVLSVRPMLTQASFVLYLTDTHDTVLKGLLTVEHRTLPVAAILKHASIMLLTEETQSRFRQNYLQFELLCFARESCSDTRCFSATFGRYSP